MQGAAMNRAKAHLLARPAATVQALAPDRLYGGVEMDFVFFGTTSHDVLSFQFTRLGDPVIIGEFIIINGKNFTSPEALVICINPTSYPLQELPIYLNGSLIPPWNKSQATSNTHPAM